jgi:error-prone DNA polymerase
MSEVELTMADLSSTGITTAQHPMQHVRDQLIADGILSAKQLRTATPNSHVRAAGVVTHRQRPATASGVTFVNLEDETGFINVIVSPGCFIRSKRTITSSAALIIRGRVERSQGVTPSLPTRSSACRSR